MSDNIITLESIQSQKIYQKFPWIPIYASGLLAWYDASDESTVFESGGNVSQWNDKSGNDYHLIQPGGNQPLWGTTDINGLNTMYYSGTTDQMYKDSIPDIDLTQLAMITVVEGRTGDWPACGALKKTDLTDKIDFRMQSNAVNGKINAGVVIDSNSYAVATADDASMAEYVPNLASLWYDGADVVVRSDGGAVSNTVNVIDGATFTINRIQVGRESNTPQNLQGELVILSTADLTTIQKVEGYLAWKWGLQAKLVAGHPYKSLPPYI